MSTIGERIASVRKDANLTLDVFGEKIGMTKGTVSRLEHDTYTPSEQTLKLICTQFGVNYAWLKGGEGEIYTKDDLVQSLVTELDLDDLEQAILTEYLKLDRKDREVFKKFIRSCMIAASKKTDH